MRRFFYWIFIVLIFGALGGCTTIRSKIDKVDNYEEITLSEMNNVVYRNGLYVVRISNENKNLVETDAEGRIHIRGIAFSFETDPNDSIHEKLAARLQNSEKLSFYFLVENTLISSEIKLTRIDGLLSVKDMEKKIADGKKQEEDRKEKEKATIESQKIILDAKAKLLATGYIYHGISEDAQNSILFSSGALEPGHAYYISSMLISNDGLTAGTYSLLSDTVYHMVDYPSQKIKGDVIVSSKALLNMYGIKVVVAGGKSPLFTPVILGIVE